MCAQYRQTQSERLACQTQNKSVPYFKVQEDRLSAFAYTAFYMSPIRTTGEKEGREMYVQECQPCDELEGECISVSADDEVYPISIAADLCVQCARPDLCVCIEREFLATDDQVERFECCVSKFPTKPDHQINFGPLLRIEVIRRVMKDVLTAPL